MDGLMTTLFTTHAEPFFCHSAAEEQDEIRWQNFIEGKISQSWGNLQLIHYQEQHSKRMVDKWTSGLVTQVLELIHRMWKHCNGVLHAVDEQGLPLQQAAELEAQIHKEFQAGTHGMARKDYHLLHLVGMR
jgi:hypothetical protein